MSCIITQGFETAFLLTQGMATSISVSGGVTQGGRAQGCAEMVANPSGGVCTGGSVAVTETVSIRGTGGVGQGGLAAVGYVGAFVAEGGSGIGGEGTAKQQVALSAGPLMTIGGSATVASPPLAVTPITQGLGTSQFLTQGYRSRMPSSYLVASSGGMGIGGVANRTAKLQVAVGGGLEDGGSYVGVVIRYRVYMNSGKGDPIDYTTPVAEVTGMGWTSNVLTLPGDYKLGVRAYDPTSGLEEQNVDAVVEVVLDPGGNDVTKVPLPPLGPRALALAGGTVRVEWTCSVTDPSRQPLGFHVYVGINSAPDYSSPASTVAWSDQREGCFSSELSGLKGGPLYSIGVRAFNAVGEEENTVVLAVSADSVAPAGIDSFEAIATSKAS